ncbi:3-oxo-tetronate kinase [Noviherbaspirillum aerium]|uniref:3-oxo-tetronate kinase n=1 Tax=Noviherbaspirillum aerium TaxID=2588497 RepID=UPI00178C67D8|nr:3-oxo-tetronate kinase [Noviherbaspirillum aerium]
MYLGCIADDFTGATDLANNLVRSGMKVVQSIGIPDGPIDTDADAVVVALKSRTIEPGLAVEQSLAAARWLREQGAQQYYFKYCSTFDSTDEGNIGPVTEALMDFLDTDFTIACPAFPDNHRTLFKGYLFVGDSLLSESGMRNHPLTPMTDANLVRVLQRQTEHAVGLIDYATVARGEGAIRDRIEELRSGKVRMAIVDAISNNDLLIMGRAFSGLKLVTAGSGVALGLPQNFGISANADAARLPAASGKTAIVSGSCSVASNAQVADFIRHGYPALPIDPLEAAGGANVIDQALQWAAPHLEDGPVLVYATAEPDKVKAVQARLGVKEAGELIEHTLSQIAAGLVKLGVRQLVVAGGETSGACVQALGITQMQIGPQIDPGVPWCFARSPFAGNEGLHITLKSGNFGTTDFFTKAFRNLS